MADESFSDTQLAMLERRWQRDPSPHLSLQLADLYRQRGRLADAVPVLEKALEEQPRYVSLQVALGRYRLEAGDAESAAEVLSEVVQRDAGHLVANKLLVKAFLALGDTARASDRLELYALLNDSDPELAALRASVSRGAPFAAAATQPVGATDLAAIAPPADRGLAGALDQPPFEQLVDEPLEPASLSAIFAALPESGPEEARPRAAIPADESAEAPAPPEAPATYETQLFELEPAVVTPEPPEAESSEEEAFETEVEAGATPPPAGAPPRELDPGAAATATLGALYLSQGHLEDARRTFEQVLARDPDDAEARAGLEEIERRETTETAPPEQIDSLRGEDAPAPRTAGAHQARIEALRRYLDRIRGAAERLSA